jgi:hypothetical protein
MLGDKYPLGKDWVQKFTKRNSQVASMIGRRKQDTIYNQRVYGIWTSMGLPWEYVQTLKLLTKQERSILMCNPSREWVIIIETIFACGAKVRPLVIFKGKDAQTSWFKAEDIPNWLVTTSKNGWTSKDIALEWLQTSFLT